MQVCDKPTVRTAFPHPSSAQSEAQFPELRASTASAIPAASSQSRTGHSGAMMSSWRGTKHGWYPMPAMSAAMSAEPSGMTMAPHKSECAWSTRKRILHSSLTPAEAAEAAEGVALASPSQPFSGSSRYSSASLTCFAALDPQDRVIFMFSLRKQAHDSVGAQ